MFSTSPRHAGRSCVARQAADGKVHIRETCGHEPSHVGCDRQGSQPRARSIGRRANGAPFIVQSDRRSAAPHEAPAGVGSECSEECLRRGADYDCRHGSIRRALHVRVGLSARPNAAGVIPTVVVCPYKRRTCRLFRNVCTGERPPLDFGGVCVPGGAVPARTSRTGRCDGAIACTRLCRRRRTICTRFRRCLSATFKAGI